MYILGFLFNFFRLKIHKTHTKNIKTRQTSAMHLVTTMLNMLFEFISSVRNKLLW